MACKLRNLAPDLRKIHILKSTLRSPRNELLKSEASFSAAEGVWIFDFIAPGSYLPLRSRQLISAPFEHQGRKR
jgi:hypothetical protein